MDAAIRDFNSKAFGFSLENALCLALASELVYCDFDYKVAISGGFTDTLLKSGFTLDRIKTFDREGSQAFLVADDEKIIISFRGTEPDALEDWVTDALIRMTAGPGGDVHRGFMRAFNYIWPDIEETIEDFRNKRQTIWLTGHSLGGALATLAAAFLQFREQPIKINGLYTFGSPRIGSFKFADNFNSTLKDLTFRFVNNNDLVTRVPPSFIYSHVGQLRYFDCNGDLFSDDQLSWWGRFWDRMEGRLENYLGFKLFDGVSDHSMSDYIKNLKNIYQVL